MMEFLSWYAEHPWLGAFLIYCSCWAVAHLGRIGSTRNIVKHKKPD